MQKFGELRSSNKTPEFKKGKDVHPLVDQQFGYVHLPTPLLDLREISTEFCGAISTPFCFSYSLGAFTAMPRRLHARLCDAFLVMRMMLCMHSCLPLVIVNSPQPDGCDISLLHRSGMLDTGFQRVSCGCCDVRELVALE